MIASREATRTLPFSCACGLEADLDITATGVAVHVSKHARLEDARSDAGIDALREARRQLALVPCPACGARGEAGTRQLRIDLAAAGAFALVAPWFVIAVVKGLRHPDPGLALRWNLILAVVAAVVVVWRMPSSSQVAVVDSSRGGRPLAPKDLARLLEYSDVPLRRRVFYRLMNAGLPRATLAELRWADVDLERGRLSVGTPARRRRVELSDEAVAALRRHKREAKRTGDKDPVFSATPSFKVFAGDLAAAGIAGEGHDPTSLRAPARGA
ncbi:MAG: hypothetical protein AB7N76_09680 [Planctomycetota bacterium]